MTTRWKARIARVEHKYHRVEVEGATLVDDPIALVIDPAHATAIAALPEVAEALTALLRAVEHDRNVGMFVEDARSALAKMEGRHQ